MDNKTLENQRVLIVDDHPMTVAGYIDSLSQKDLFIEPFVFTTECI